MTLHRQSSNAVLPEPTGPPTPILRGLRIVRIGRADCKCIVDSSVEFPQSARSNAGAALSCGEFYRLPWEDDQALASTLPDPVAVPRTQALARRKRDLTYVNNRRREAPRGLRALFWKARVHRRREDCTAAGFPC